MATEIDREIEVETRWSKRDPELPKVGRARVQEGSPLYWRAEPPPWDRRGSEVALGTFFQRFFVSIYWYVFNRFLVHFGSHFGCLFTIFSMSFSVLVFWWFYLQCMSNCSSVFFRRTLADTYSTRGFI